MIVILIAGQVLAAAPVLAQEAARAGVTAADRAMADVSRRVDKAAVHINRTRPTVTAPNIDPTFGADVTTADLMRARILPEQLVPTSEPTADQNAVLARMLEHLTSSSPERQPALIDQYIEDDPASPWRGSLLVNAGTLYSRHAYFSRAAAYGRQAWELPRDRDDSRARVIADYALGESLNQMITFGQVDRLDALLKEADGRILHAPASTKVSDARNALFMLSEHHEMALFSGPQALKMYLTVRPIANLEASVATIERYHPTPAGTSMTELRDLAKSVGANLSMWHAASAGEFPVPSIVHLRSDHFSAIVEAKDGKYRLRDPGLGGDIWVTAEALRDESTGYVLAATRPLGDEWTSASEAEGQSIIGHCFPGKPNGDDPPPADGNCGGGGGPGDSNHSTNPRTPQDPFATAASSGGETPRNSCIGMPHYRFHPTAAALVIEDAPVGYTPPVGPDMTFELEYNHYGYKTPSTFGYGNVGPLWTFNALSYITETTQALPPYSGRIVSLRGHGLEVFTPYNATTVFSGAALVEVSHEPARYERRLPDGSVEVFALADRAASLPARRIFLTQVIDPHGQTLSYTYDSSFRLVAVTDAIGQVTTFAYENGSDANLLTKVTDPFGRFAVIGYDDSGRLSSITDAAGMPSTFSYGTDDFIVAMTTPYGTTTFRHQPSTGERWVEATDPDGGRERLEQHLTDGLGAVATELSANVPTGFSASNAELNLWNTFYWDKLAMAQHPGDLSQAVVTRWLMAEAVPYGHAVLRPVPHTIKRPLESRIWYRYPGEIIDRTLSYDGIEPVLIGRVLEDGVSQVTSIAYNTQRHVTSITDPIGRQTTFTYASNGRDLTEVRQAVSGGTDLLQTVGDYNSQALPETLTDAAGQETTVTYNAFGQPLTITNAKSQTTTFTYETTTQNLLSVTGPVSGATTTFTYDAYNRVATAEGADGYVVTMAYDALDRPTSRTFPDASTESQTYARLDLASSTDRLGRITRFFYDGYGRRVATRDPLGRTISFDWCNCGVLNALIDAKGQRTSWERDVEGRVTRELRADATTDTNYTYDLAGRVKTVTDPLDQVTTYTYNLDGSLASTGFTNETIATPDISYIYDTYYPRPLTMVDGSGTTTYAYVAAGTNGAGQLASVDGPFSSDTMVYTYDELGRLLTRKLNGTGTTITYDTLGRLSQLEFPIGAFDYTYVGTTGRRSSLTYPNGQTTTYSYLDDEHDFRLQTIHHKNPSAATLSKFDYTYDVAGNIMTWRQERAGAAAKIYTFTHDLVDQLTSAVLTDTDTTPTILKRQAWAYDVAGNRTVDQTDDAVFATTHDTLNRLQSRAPGGPIVFEGSLNEAGTVTIDGQPATVDASNNFHGTANLTSATTTVTLKAKDASGNETTQQYEVDRSGTTTSYTYDANGNLTSDGTKTYFWNALNQLVEVKEGSTTIATFEYDGAGRRTEKVAAGLTHQYIYDSEDIGEERISGSSSDNPLLPRGRHRRAAGAQEQQRRRHVLPRRSSRQHRAGEQRGGRDHVGA